MATRTVKKQSAGTGSYAKIYAAVRRVPLGRVATYGQIARIAGLPGHSVVAGWEFGEGQAASAVFATK